MPWTYKQSSHKTVAWDFCRLCIILSGTLRRPPPASQLGLLSAAWRYVNIDSSQRRTPLSDVHISIKPRGVRRRAAVLLLLLLTVVLKEYAWRCEETTAYRLARAVCVVACLHGEERMSGPKHSPFSLIVFVTNGMSSISFKNEKFTVFCLHFSLFSPLSSLFSGILIHKQQKDALWAMESFLSFLARLKCTLTNGPMVSRSCHHCIWEEFSLFFLLFILVKEVIYSS